MLPALLLFPICLLRFLCVLLHVECHGHDDDHTFDDVRVVIVHTQQHETVVDNTHDQDTAEDACDTAHTAGMGSPAHGSRCDRIQFVVQTGTCRVCRACTACEHDTGQSREHAAPYICEHQIFLYIDTSHTRRLVIAADRIQTLAETGLAQDESCQGEDNEEDQHDDRERPDLRASQEAVSVRQVRHGPGGKDLCRRTADKLPAQRGDKRRHLRICDDRTLHQTDQCAHKETYEDRCESRELCPAF